ncbi:hypothetical protein STIUS_v1c01580 [Spiroplasma sp. TIUS-1]|uniref:hypothetical protein n=1 Tax=Spiroplasma sp. TIUS-1 TaxID=216963 RepID=UPI001398657D|nr:hypothetical protein [Spiroplasma sp. TIUS-1]QHX35713.1 hypothetical protein STIUS_v1c01580 [Spiroplasma sp. TIUS-1]
MKLKLVDMFSPSKNWKTTLILVFIVSIITIGSSLFMGFRYSNDLGDVENFWLIAKYEHTFSYIRYIWNHYENENSLDVIFADTKINKSAQVFALASDYLLISLICGFIVIIPFVINHFRLVNIVTKNRRILNSSIVLVSSLGLLLTTFHYWIAYFQTIPILNEKEWMGTGNWFPTWQTILQLTVILFGVTMVVAMSIYNVVVEAKTRYISISQKYALENKKPEPDNILSE